MTKVAFAGSSLFIHVLAIGIVCLCTSYLIQTFFGFVDRISEFISEEETRSRVQARSKMVFWDEEETRSNVTFRKHFEDIRVVTLSLMQARSRVQARSIKILRTPTWNELAPGNEFAPWNELARGNELLTTPT